MRDGAEQGPSASAFNSRAFWGPWLLRDLSKMSWQGILCRRFDAPDSIRAASRQRTDCMYAAVPLRADMYKDFIQSLPNPTGQSFDMAYALSITTSASLGVTVTPSPHRPIEHLPLPAKCTVRGPHPGKPSSEGLHTWNSSILTPYLAGTEL